MSTPNGTNGTSGNGSSENTHHYATRSIHVGSEPDPTTGSVVPVLDVATTYLQDGIGKHRVSPVYALESGDHRADIDVDARATSTLDPITRLVTPLND